MSTPIYDELHAEWCYGDGPFAPEQHAARWDEHAGEWCCDEHADQHEEVTT